MDKLKHIIEILKTELLYVDKDSEFDKGVHCTLEHVIQIVEAHIEE